MRKSMKFAALALATVLAACSSPHKAKKIETKMEKSEAVVGNESVGVKDGNMVIQKKVVLSEELRRIQYEVYELEDRVYGNRKYGSKGLYGSLKDCRLKISDKKYGGDGKLMWTEPLERVTDKEDEFKMGIDESDKLVGISEEFLKDRITRFRGYKSTLQLREDEYEDKLAICRADLKSREHDVKKAKGQTPKPETDQDTIDTE
jgi:hypothetical protein